MYSQRLSHFQPEDVAGHNISQYFGRMEYELMPPLHHITENPEIYS